MGPEKSTTVRFLSEESPPDLPAPLPGRAPIPVRAVFRGLDLLAPEVAARVVDHLWFRLQPPPPEADRSAATPADGRRFTTTSPDGLRVHGHNYGPADAPVAVLVHGWAGWWQQLAAHVAPLLAEGYRVVVYDAPSHGASPAGRYGPRSSRVMELADAYTAIAHQHGPPDLVVAHSIGAMATLWAARHAGTTAGAYAFLAAAAWVHPMADFFTHVLSLGPRTRARVVRRVERRIGHRFAEFAVPDLAASAWADRPRPPLLAIHDRSDRMVPARGTAAIGADWDGSETVYTTGLGHNRLLRDAAVVDRVTTFAAQHRPSATCTAVN